MVEAMSMRFQEDQSHHYAENAAMTLYGLQGSEEAYLSVLATNSGNKAIRDPFGWVDGGNRIGGSTYAIITDPYMIAVAILSDLMDEWDEIWYSTTSKYGHRIAEFGAWTSPDPHNTSGTNDCTGRDRTRHNITYLNSTYTSDFVQEFRAAHITTDHLIEPTLSPFNPVAAASSHEITMTPFGYRPPPGCADYRTGKSEIPADGTWPYISSGVEIRYTLDGTEPTTASTLYSAAITVDDDDATDSVVTLKAKAFHASYGPSPTVTSTYNTFSGAGSLVRSVFSNSGTGTANTRTVTFGSAPPEGNLLIAVAAARNPGINARWRMASSGWTPLYEPDTESSGRLAYGSWYKFAGASESTDVTANLLDAPTGDPDGAVRVELGVVEVSSVGAFSQKADNFSGIGPFSAVVTGTVASEAAGKVAFAILSIDSDTTNAPGSFTYSNSFTTLVDSPTLGTAARAMTAFASKVLDTSGSVTTTGTAGAADSLDEFSGMIATFDAPDLIDPTVLSAEVNADGDELTVTLSESCAGGVGLSLSGDGNNAGPFTLGTVAKSEGDTVFRYSVSPTVNVTQSDIDGILNGIAISYDADTGDIEDDAGNPLASFAAFQVTNNSEQGQIIVDGTGQGEADGTIHMIFTRPFGLWGDTITVDNSKITEISQVTGGTRSFTVGSVIGAGGGTLQVIITPSPLAYSTASGGALTVTIDEGWLTDENGDTTAAFTGIADGDNSSTQEPAPPAGGAGGGGAKRSRCRSRARASQVGGGG